MTVYHAAVVDGSGRFDPKAFRIAFLRALEHRQIDVSKFLLHEEPPIHAEDSSLVNSPISEEEQPAAVALSQKMGLSGELEELSDIEDSDQASVSRSDSSSSGGGTGKIKIVFDLDNTLLHAVSRIKLNGADIMLDDFRDGSNRPELFKFTLPRQRSQAYYIKFRPGIRQLISELSRWCDLAIHTNATREYADVVMSIIDPDRTLFGIRAAARDDDSGQNDRKDMNRLFQFDKEKLLQECLILDDRRDVWDSVYERNIIQCNYYEYFDSRRPAIIKKYHGDDSSETAVVATEQLEIAQPNNNQIEDIDRQLPFLQNLIVKIAKEFYQSTSPSKSVANELQKQRANILSGTVCLMTGYHRLEQPSQVGMLDNGPQHRRRLEYMGAKVVDTPSPQVTHVVVMRQTLSTDRARTLCSRDTKFVHNLWIYACEQTWMKVDERFFDATSLLAKYPTPPSRPIFEHWPYTKMFYESLISQGILPELDQDDDINHDNIIDLPHVAKKRRVSSETALKSREWVASGLFSDGAEVWSCSEHVVLKFDPFVARKTSLVT